MLLEARADIEFEPRCSFNDDVLVAKSFLVDRDKVRSCRSVHIRKKESNAGLCV